MLEKLLINQAIATFITLLKSFLENPKAKATWKKAILKVFKEIAKQFKDDEEFTSVFD